MPAASTSSPTAAVGIASVAPQRTKLGLLFCFVCVSLCVPHLLPTPLQFLERYQSLALGCGGIFFIHFTDKETEAVHVGGVALRMEPRSDTKAAVCRPPHTAHAPLLSSFVLLPGTKKPQLFSDQTVFHNKPSGAFPHSAGSGLRALLAATLPTSGEMCFEVCRFHG